MPWTQRKSLSHLSVVRRVSICRICLCDVRGLVCLSVCECVCVCVCVCECVCLYIGGCASVCV